ncbi:MULTISPECIES: helix-turn-helix domain-containing protein [unclassified Streptomyces]|uniref:helix-turn-helix domain-containing protein n=1 Tax=unclassified Streptomyces TaxID=2593676 RepID=UPI0037F87EE0
MPPPPGETASQPPFRPIIAGPRPSPARRRRPISPPVLRRLTARQQAHLVEQRATGEHFIADLAELFSVSRATVYRVLERARISP